MSESPLDYYRNQLTQSEKVFHARYQYMCRIVDGTPPDLAVQSIMAIFGWSQYIVETYMQGIANLPHDILKKRIKEMRKQFNLS